MISCHPNKHMRLSKKYHTMCLTASANKSEKTFFILVLCLESITWLDIDNKLFVFATSF